MSYTESENYGLDQFPSSAVYEDDTNLFPDPDELDLAAMEPWGRKPGSCRDPSRALYENCRRTGSIGAPMSQGARESIEKEPAFPVSAYKFPWMTAEKMCGSGSSAGAGREGMTYSERHADEIAYDRRNYIPSVPPHDNFEMGALTRSNKGPEYAPKKSWPLIARDYPWLTERMTGDDTLFCVTSGNLILFVILLILVVIMASIMRGMDAIKEGISMLRGNYKPAT